MLLDWEFSSCRISRCHMMAGIICGYLRFYFDCFTFWLLTWRKEASDCHHFQCEYFGIPKAPAGGTVHYIIELANTCFNYFSAIEAAAGFCFETFVSPALSRALYQGLQGKVCILATTCSLSGLSFLSLLSGIICCDFLLTWCCFM